MIRFMRAAILILVGFSAAVLMVRLTPLDPTNAAWGAISTNPDGSICDHPCIFGVFPGLTDKASSLTILKAHPFLENTAFPNTTDRLIGAVSIELITQAGHIRVIFEHNQETVGIVSISQFTGQSPTVGDVIGAFGAPDYLLITPIRHSYYDVFLLYIKLGIEVRLATLAQDTVKPGNVVAEITMNAGTDDISESCQPPYCQSWRGFASIPAYVGSALH